MNSIQAVLEFSMALKPSAFAALDAAIVIFASRTIIPNRRPDYQPI